jgi:glucan biosynthesis protein
VQPRFVLKLGREVVASGRKDVFIRKMAAKLGLSPAATLDAARAWAGAI